MRLLTSISLAALAAAMPLAAPALAQAPWSATGELTDSDSVGEEQHRFDSHNLRLEAGQRYRISVNSEAFDPVARLYRQGDNATPVAENDDSGGTLNSRINFTPDASGNFVLRVSAFSADGRGAYTAAALVPPPPPPGVPVPWSTAGQITDSDATTGEGRYDDYSLRLEGGRRYVFTVESSAFDPIASLYRAGEDDVLAQNDDSGGTLNSRISFLVPEGGDYILRVAPLGSDGRGDYRAAAGLAPPLPAPITGPGTPTQVTGTWSLHQGDLAATDPEVEGHHFDDYLIHVEAGQIRYISLDAAAFDPMVQVIAVSARDSDPLETMESDDDGGAGVNSLLAFQPEAAGDYIVRVTSFGEASTGAYRLWISQ
jgi:hypothetical protein